MTTLNYTFPSLTTYTTSSTSFNGLIYNGTVSGGCVTTFESWQSGGCTTPLQYDFSFPDSSELKTQWEQPDHIFESDTDGCCRSCADNNVYRFSDEYHAPIINEEPEGDDWWQLLAS